MRLSVNGAAKGTTRSAAFACHRQRRHVASAVRRKPANNSPRLGGAASGGPGGASTSDAWIMGDAAATAKDPPKQSPLVGALEACRAIADPTQRLACYDKQAGALLDAAQTGDVAVVDKAEVRKARKSLFGFTMPNIPFFAGDKSADEAPERRRLRHRRDLLGRQLGRDRGAVGLQTLELRHDRSGIGRACGRILFEQREHERLDRRSHLRVVPSG